MKLAVVVLTLAAFGATAPAAEAKLKFCGHVHKRTGHDHQVVKLRVLRVKRNISCAESRRIVKRFYNNIVKTAHTRWACTMQMDTLVCARRRDGRVQGVVARTVPRR
jgi:hypothetical protein